MSSKCHQNVTQKRLRNKYINDNIIKKNRRKNGGTKNVYF